MTLCQHRRLLPSCAANSGETADVLGIARASVYKDIWSRIRGGGDDRGLEGSEQALLHAEKDLTTKVEHDASHWVGHDRDDPRERNDHH